MRALGLDLSSSTGFAILDKDVQGKPKLLKYGLIKPIAKDFLVEEYRYLSIAKQIGNKVRTIIDEYNPNLIYIEQSNKGKNRHSQKLIEFIHCEVLDMIKVMGLADSVVYIDTSFWRKTLNQRLSKDQRIHNKAVKEGKVRGKITPKHLSVQWVNENYNQSFKLKDNDITDAICVATTGLILYDQIGQNNVDDKLIEQALS